MLNHKKKFVVGRGERRVYVEDLGCFSDSNAKFNKI